MTYLLYYGSGLDIYNGNVPLVLAFHGHANTALYLAESSDWPEIGLKNGFMTVCLDNYDEQFDGYNPADIIALIDILKEEYSIDDSKIYVTGFSNGSDITFDLMEKYPEKFAAFAPMNGYFTIQSGISEGTVVPTFYIGAQNSPLTELPCHSETILNRVQSVLHANNANEQLDVDIADMEKWENSLWGKDGDIVYQVNDEEEFNESILTVNLYQSEDGHFYTALADSSKQGHQVYSRNCWAAWDFISQFSRAEDGSIIINEVTYNHPSKDEMVVNNNYNSK